MIGFNDWTITPEEYHWLVDFCKRRLIKNVIEFGMGMSTKAFLEAGCSVQTCETNLEYLNAVEADLQKLFPDGDLYATVYDEGEWIPQMPIILDSVDLAFVDGPMGKVWTPSRINTAMFACSRFPLIGFHDTNRDREKHTMEIFLGVGFQIVEQTTDQLGLVIIKPPENK